MTVSAVAGAIIDRLEAVGYRRLTTPFRSRASGSTLPLCSRVSMVGARISF